MKLIFILNFLFMKEFWKKYIDIDIEAAKIMQHQTLKLWLLIIQYLKFSFASQE